MYVAGKPKTGCITRNETTPYQFQCVFSKDPEAKQDFSVYFHSLDQKQGIFNRGLSAFVISGFIGAIIYTDSVVFTNFSRILKCFISEPHTFSWKLQISLRTSCYCNKVIKYYFLSGSLAFIAYSVHSHLPDYMRSI